MSNRRGFILAFSGLLTLGAVSVQAQDVYRKTDNAATTIAMTVTARSIYKDSVYADETSCTATRPG